MTLHCSKFVFVTSFVAAAVLCYNVDLTALMDKRYITRLVYNLGRYEGDYQ